jgi:hypothetical protein
LSSTGFTQGTWRQFEREYESNLQQIEALKRPSDSAALQSLLGQCELKWRDRDPEQYYLLLKAGINTLIQYRPIETTNLVSITNYSRKAWGVIDRIPVDTALVGLMHLHEYVYETWPLPFLERRKLETTQWLSTWSNLVRTISESNSLPKEVYLDAPLPKGLKMGFSGMPPEAIQDKKLRAEYETNIEVHRQTARRLLAFQHASNNQKLFENKARQRIVYLYSNPPKRLEELKELLGGASIPEPSKKQILANFGG